MPVENLFRRPVEYLSAAACVTASALLASNPEVFQVTAPTAWVTGATLLSYGTWQWRGGQKISRFQAGLKRLPFYQLRPEQIPCLEKALFLGKGFRWGEKHTQRLHDARLPENEHLAAINARYDTLRQREALNPDHWRNRLTARENWDIPVKIGKIQFNIPLRNPVAQLPPVGGNPEIHGVGVLDETIVTTALGELFGHMVVLGTTRVGKTRLCEVLVAQDIHRGDTTIVFDPKGDVKLLQRMYAEAKRAGREDNMWVFHLGYPHISDRYSPIADYSKITEVATRIANALPSEGQSAAFRDFVWRFVNMIAKTGAALGDSPSYKWLYTQATNIDGLAERYFRQYLSLKDANWQADYERMEETLKKSSENMTKKAGRSPAAAMMSTYIQVKGYQDDTAEAITSVLASEKSYFEKLVSSLYPLLEKLTTGEAGKLLSPDASDLSDTRRIFSWENVLKTKGIVYVGLDALSDYEVAGCVGNAMFADLTSLAGRIYKENKPGTPDRVRIHADEFNELVGDEFVPMLNKAGGAGYQVTVYTQTWDDVEARVGNRAKAAQMAGNLNSMIMLRVKNITTAEMLTNQLPMVNLVMKTTVSGSSDGGQEGTHFGAKTEDRFTTREVPTLQPADLVKLPKGQAFALLDGGQLFKIRLPLPDETNDPCWPSDLNAVFEDMQRKYNVQGDESYFGPSRTLARAVGFDANGRALNPDSMAIAGGTANELALAGTDATLLAQLVGNGVALEGKHLGW